ncbi:MAG: single-stranded DNA-binding protein [Ruminococcaceae bacterium]|nr:single-stranded DNA-binding protein [Oscillospiraceae bacterium]
MEQNFNRVVLCGVVTGEPYLSHINHGESFYKFPLSVPRLSGQSDELTVVAPWVLLERAPCAAGERLRVLGQLRSFNNKSGQGRRLVISVFARELGPGGLEPENCIQLSGVICKAPVLRRTPLGRDICDIILAVNRRYGRADYLPCIAWGAVAQQTAAMGVGRRLTLEGRVQSRTYTKVLPSGAEERVAYEVSIMRPAEIEEFTEQLS